MALPDGTVPPKKNKTLTYVLIACGLGLFCLCGPILGAILLPVFAQARLAAQKTASLTNVKQLALAALTYSADNDDKLPLAANWRQELNKVDPKIEVMTSPKFRGFGYAYSKFAVGKSVTKLPLTTVLFFESDLPGDGPVDDPANLPNPPRFGKGSCVSFADGSAKIVPDLLEK
ncbi:MAG: hypothetical protein ACOYON_08315 [Fimbriimonas sp.]